MNSASRAVAGEAKQRDGMVAVQGFDGVVQAVLRVVAVGRRKWIVDIRRPAHLLKHIQNDFLALRGDAKTLDDAPIHAECSGIAIPVGARVGGALGMRVRVRWAMTRRLGECR